MDELTRQVHYSGTFFGEPLGLAVTKAMLNQLREDPPWDRLYNVGQILKEQWNGATSFARMSGHPTRPEVDGSQHQEALFRRGHITQTSPWYMTRATEETDVANLIRSLKCRWY